VKMPGHRRQWLILAILALVAATYAACGCARSGSPGRAEALRFTTDNSGASEALEMRFRDGSRLRVPAGGKVDLSSADSRQPLPAKQSAQAAADAGGARGETGDAAEISLALGRLGIFQWVGVALVIFGGVVWLGKRAGLAAQLAGGAASGLSMVLAQVPKGSGLLLMATGAVLVVLPWFLESYGWILAVAVAMVLSLLLARFAWRLYRRERFGAPRPPDRDADGNLPDPHADTREVRR